MGTINSLSFLSTIGGVTNKVMKEGYNPLWMKILQIRIHSCASLVVSCVTPLIASLEDCLSSKLSKE